MCAHNHDSNPWQHLFPPNKQLLQLRTLGLRYVEQGMTRVHLQTCGSCCSNVQELGISWALRDGVLPHALLQLSRLTSLTTFVSDAKARGCWHTCKGCRSCRVMAVPPARLFWQHRHHADWSAASDSRQAGNMHAL